MRTSALRQAWILAAVGLMMIAGCDDDGAVEKTAGNPVEFEGGLVVTEAWAGQWNVVTTFSDCNTGATTIIEDVVDWICPGDTIRLDGTGLTAGCTGTATDGALNASCEYRFADGDCLVMVTLGLDLERSGDRIAGSGTWSASVSAACDERYPVGCERLVIEATRLDGSIGACDSLRSAAGPSGLLERFRWTPRPRR